MPITVNESGTLYELDTVTTNENGTLYDSDTVYANEGGTLYEIHGTFPPNLVWIDPDTTDNTKIISQSADGSTVTVQGNSAPGYVTKTIHTQTIKFKSGDTINVLCTGISSDNSSADNMLSVSIKNETTGTVEFASTLHKNGTFSQSIPNGGEYQIHISGFCPPYSTAIVRVSASVTITR